MRSTRIAGAFCAFFGLACDGSTVQPPLDAGTDRTGTRDPDGDIPPFDAAPRLLPHDHVMLPQMEVGVVYIGDVDAGDPPSEDSMLTWLLGSTYWLNLDEYGIGAGAIAGSTSVPAGAFFQSGDVVDGGLVDIVVMETRIVQALHGDDAGTPASVSLPSAQAFVFVLPDGINVALGHRGNYTYQTCIDENGYHSYDGLEPYAVLPPCVSGRSLYAASHELAEVATDPQPFKGWASDVDIPVNGGEVADLCNDQTVLDGGQVVAELWSNQTGGCVPAP
jgi:hypothetical protein